MRYCQISFNPANFIALPMLVGIGASFGMQVVARAWEEGAETMLSFSTGPAVIFSALMAMSGFGSLLWSNHVGVRSLGFIVTAAVAANLVASLILLPAIIRLIRGRNRQS
jgi:predicted RND superfamily exporter protein